MNKEELKEASRKAEKDRREPQGIFLDRGIMRSLQSNYSMNLKFEPLDPKKKKQRDLRKAIKAKMK